MIIDDNSVTKPITKAYRDELLADLRRRVEDGTAEVRSTPFRRPGFLESKPDETR